LRHHLFGDSGSGGAMVRRGILAPDARQPVRRDARGMRATRDPAEEARPRRAQQAGLRDGRELATAGLFLDLPPRGAQLFEVRR